MNPKTSTKTLMYRTAAILTIVMMLFAALPATPARAVSLNITSAGSGTWEATAWPSTLRSGTITVALGDVNVVGTGTAFLTELSVGNILRTTTELMIGTVASITSDTQLTLVNPAATARTNIAYHVQGVGPADNAIIAATHNVTIAANPVIQTGTVTVNPGGILTVADPGTIFSTLTVGGTVEATTGNDFGELIVNNGGVVNAGTNGAYTASSLTINSGGTVNISRDFTVDSTTVIAGTISFSSTSITARAMKFLGSVTLSSGATWNEATVGNGANNTYDFFGNFTNNASVFTTSDTSIHAFAGAGKTLSGSTNTAIARVTVAGTYTNNGTLSVSNTLTGTGALTNGAAGTLNVSFNVSINTLANAGTMNKTGPGAITTPLASFTNTGTLNLNSTGTIAGITNNAGGTVNLINSGLISGFNNATATSVLNISDLTPPNITTLTVTAPGNTVNYNGAGDQTVTAMTYYNLIFSGSGNKSISLPNGSTLTTGNLSIAPTGTAKASITGPNLVVNSLTLGGLGKVNGTWGSTSSVATFTDDNFFALTAGYLNVATDTRLSQTINFTSTAPSNATVGGSTYTPTATATSTLPVTFTIDATASSVCSISAGIVSFNAAGTCVINANQAGNANYKPATQAQQSFAVNLPGSIARVFIGEDEMLGSPFGLSAGASLRRSFAGINNGPVQIEANVDIVAAERLIYKAAGGVNTSFSEMMGLPANQLDNTYWLPWYNNVDLDTQLRFANVTGSTATVHVFIGEDEMLGSPFTLAPGESTRKSFAGINNGPVEIQSNQNIVAAERLIYKVNNVATSFTETMAIPESQLDNTYWLPWYNNVDLDTQLRIANVSGSPATVTVTIGGVAMPSFNLAAGESARKSYAGVNNGPVQIVSTQNIVAAERLIYKVNGVNTSFSEMMALPENQLNTTFWLPWYNNVDLDTQLRFANTTNSTATVHVYIGGVEMQGSPFTLLAGESTRKSFATINDGPVQIVSNVAIVAAERLIYKVNGVNASFSEMMALPNSQLDTTYWFPWYNNVDLDTQLRFGMPE
jgi:hypothetical protein